MAITSEGERDAARALIRGDAEAACMIDGNHLLFSREGTLPSGTTRVLAVTPPYDHCNFTVLDGAPDDLVSRFRESLLGMSYADPVVRPAFGPRGNQAVAGRQDRGVRVLERGGGPVRYGGTVCAAGRWVMHIDLGGLGFDEGGGAGFWNGTFPIR